VRKVITQLPRAQGPFLRGLESTQRAIASTYQKLCKQRLSLAIREFHDSFDTTELTKQLSGQAAADNLTLPAAEFELQEQAAIASILFKPIEDDKTRVKFVRALIKLCRRQETGCQRHRSESRLTGLCIPMGLRASKRQVLLYLIGLHKNFDLLQRNTIVIICLPQDLHIVSPHPICLTCSGSEELSHERRLRHVPRKTSSRSM
jgi:hypothetical protein